MKVIGSGLVAAQALADLTTKHGGELMKLSKDQLSALCVSRGLNAAGYKPDLATRLGTPSAPSAASAATTAPSHTTNRRR